MDNLQILKARTNQRNFDLMMERTSEKQLDKMVDEINKKYGLVLKRNVRHQKRSLALGKTTGKLPDDPFLTSFLAYVVGAFSGRKRKSLMKLFEGHFGPEVMGEVELLLVETSPSYYELPPLMESEIEVMVGFEPIMQETLEFYDAFENKDTRTRCSVRMINEEVRKLQGKKVPASSEKVKKKDDLVKMFFNLYSKFKSKLAEFSITSPEKIESFMIRMTDMVQRIRVKQTEAGVDKPKVKNPPSTVQEHLEPSIVGLKLSDILANVD
jgi:hypothetical protein